MSNRWKYKRQSSVNDFFKELRDFIVQNASKEEDKVSYLDQLSNSEEFNELALKAARRIVNYHSVENAKSWREAARKSMRGKEVYNALRKELSDRNRYNDLIDKSAEQIRTLPHHIANRIVKKIGELTLQGIRASEIAAIINKELMPYAKASSTLISRTQVSKVLTTITQSRCESVNVNAYIWRTVGGPLVRDSHRHMEDVICLWDEPPCPELLAKIPTKELHYYHPGGIYNCRCYAEPLLTLEQTTWPHKVCYRGKITRMTKKQFTSILS